MPDVWNNGFENSLLISFRITTLGLEAVQPFLLYSFIFIITCATTYGLTSLSDILYSLSFSTSISVYRYAFLFFRYINRKM